MKHSAFTLAELLIALAILGVIAAFTIPKILTAQQYSKSNATTKEMAAAVAGAYQMYQLKNTPTAAMVPSDLMPYFNYVALYTDGRLLVDKECDGGSSVVCDATSPCIQMTNGGVLQMLSSWSFGSTAKTASLTFRFDANGKYDNVSVVSEPGASVGVLLYFDGFLTNRGNARPNSSNSSFPSYGPVSNCDPPWLKW